MKIKMKNRFKVIEIKVPNGLCYHLYDDKGRMLEDYSFNAPSDILPKWLLFPKEEPFDIKSNINHVVHSISWWITLSEDEIKALDIATEM